MSPRLICLYFASIFLSALIIFSIPSKTYSASVNPDGSLSHSIDINLPPGTNGMAPRLSLVYNSNAKNGMLGIGWQLSGLPAVTRDTNYPINYNGNDHYTGPNGEMVRLDDGTYHYKEETFSRIQPVGRAGDGPEYWIETLKDGTKLYYGLTADSRITALDHSPSIRVWALSKVEDLYGNYYTVEYCPQDDSGEYYPKSIKYTQGNNLTNFRYVEFIYSVTRPDYYPNYRYHTRIETRKLLLNIIIRVDPVVIFGFTFGGQVRKYKFNYNYQAPLNLHNIARLAGVEEHGSADGLLQTFDLTYQDEDNISFSTRSLPLWGGYDTNGQWLTLDFNGDGFTDIVHVVPDAANGYVNSWISQGNGYFTCKTFVPGGYDASAGKWLTMDINGDGKTDMVHSLAYPGNFHKWMSNGDGTFTLEPFTAGSSIFPGDVNGDERMDILYAGLPVFDQVCWPEYPQYSDPTMPNPIPCANYYSNLLIPGDYNGDGYTDSFAPYKLDLLWEYGCYHDCCSLDPTNPGQCLSYCVKCSNAIHFLDYKNIIVFSNGTNLDKNNYENLNISNIRYYLSDPLAGQKIYPGDYNGDGLTDLVLISPHDAGLGCDLYINNGSDTGYRFNTPIHYDWPSGDEIAYTGDFNGDGMTDLYVLTHNYSYSGNWLYISNGKGFNTPIYSGWPSVDERYKIHIGDFDGDGKADLYVLSSSQPGNWLYLSNNPVPENKLINITNGIGGTTTIEYTLATKLAGAIVPSQSGYPVSVNNSPRYLVTAITETDGREGLDSTSAHTYTTQYSYYNGKIYKGQPSEREDLYFQSITVRNKENRKYTVTHYYQNSDLRGRPSLIQEYAGNGSLTKTQTFNYSVANKCDGKTKFVQTDSITSSTYEMGNFVSSNVIANTYDAYGNIYLTTDTIPGYSDATQTQVEYCPPDEAYGALNRIKSITKSGNGARYVSQCRYFFYQGNIINRISEYYDAGNRWIETHFGYDQFGNVTSITDPLNHTTNIVYDTDYHTFPETVTNAKGQRTNIIYDPGTGNTLFVTDPNNQITSYEYDEFGRLHVVKEPGENGLAQTIYYIDFGIPNAQCIKTEINDPTADNQGRKFWQTSYFDGLNREYRQETKARDANNGKMVTTKTYNEFGSIKKQSNPYYFTDNTVAAASYTVYHYDIIGRMT